jgi:hypothetical protein
MSPQFHIYTVGHGQSFTPSRDDYGIEPIANGPAKPEAGRGAGIRRGGERHVRQMGTAAFVELGGEVAGPELKTDTCW